MYTMFLSNKLPKSLGVSALLMAALMLPTGCEREVSDAVQPGGRGAGAARLDQAGCQTYFFGRNLGTWSVVPDSRFQAVIGVDGVTQYVAQILPGPGLGSRFLVRGGSFIGDGSFNLASGIPPTAVNCFDQTGGSGWFVAGFNVSKLGDKFETVSAPDGSPAYRVKDRFQGVTDAFNTKAFLGTWTVVPDAPLEARRIPGYGLVVAQNVTSVIPFERSKGRDCFIIRGRNILQRGDVNLPDLLDRGRTEAFAGPETNLTGLFIPADALNLSIPGYELVPAEGGFDPTYRKLP
jgi:hypothetical protein